MKPSPFSITNARFTDSATLPDARRCAEMWFGALCIALAGYAIAGKGFAYIGIPPLFVGEFLAAIGVLVLITSRGLAPVMGMPVVWLLSLLVLWGTARTLPYVATYKVDALRDAVLFGYSIFAFAVAATVIASPQLLSLALVRYRGMAKVFLCVVPVIFIGEHVLGGDLPSWPWSNTPILAAKGGDVMVHCAGIIAFWIAGFAGATSPYWLALLLPITPLAGLKNRGGLFSFLMVFSIVLIARPRSIWTRRIIIAGLCMLLAAAVTDISFKLPGARREVSFWQFVRSLESMVGDSGSESLDNTKAWRLEWWRDITNYTLRGEYFWTGKGFGINLADDDGYQVLKDKSLRSPHNGHLNMLARAGVPGIALWFAAHGAWAMMMFGKWYTTQRRNEHQWAGLFMFLLVYWMAFMSNAMFDVFLEGPMGGIWFWSLYGLGLAAAWLHSNQPEILIVDETPARP